MDPQENASYTFPDSSQKSLPTFNDLVGAIGQLTGLVAQTVNFTREQQIQVTNQNNQHRSQNSLHDFIRKNPPEFEGKPDPDITDSWKNKIAKIFDAMQCTSEEKLRFAVYTLQEGADLWWKLRKANLEKAGIEITWEKFLQEFDRQYYPEYIQDKKEEEFNKLTQKEMSVAEYEDKFTSLSRFAPTITTDTGRKARKFVKGLKPYIQEKMALFRYEEYQVAVTHALNIETNWPTSPQNLNQGYKRIGSSDSENKNNEEFSSFNKKQKGINQGQMNQQVQPNKTTLCDKCNRWHYGSCLPICQTCNKRHTGVCYLGEGVCFNCGGKGHIARFCPKLMTPNSTTSTGNDISKKKMTG